MTNSYKVKPQRQVRDQVAMPETPKNLAKPAAPLEIPQQVGGQLLDKREYLPDPKVGQALEAMTTWSGATTKLNKQLGEERVQKAKQDAEKLIQQETYALQQSLKNASEVEALRAKKKFREARYAQLKNPYINFFYYGQKATDAGNIIGTKLAKWGQDNADVLARMESPSERAAFIQAESDTLKQPYSNLPQNWVEARIDPQIAVKQAEIKNLVAEKELDIAQETINHTVGEAITGKLILGGEFNTVTGPNSRGVAFAEGAFGLGYEAGFKKWVELGQPGGRRAYNAWFFKNLPSLFIDNNKNNYNDLAETLGSETLLKGLENVKTSDGIKLLDAKFEDEDGDKITMRERIQNVLVEELNRKNKEHTAILKEMTNAQGLYKKEVLETIGIKYAEFGENPTPDQVQGLRDELYKDARERSAKGHLPYSLEKAILEIDKILPLQGRKPSAIEAGLWGKELESYKADKSLTELPSDFLTKIQGTTFFGKALTEFQKSRYTGGTASKGMVDNVVKTSLEGLNRALGMDPEFSGIDESVMPAAQKSELQNEAYNLAKLSFAREAREMAPAIYEHIEENNPGQSKEWYEEETARIIKSRLLSRPEYNDIDSYFDIGGKTDTQGGTPGFGQRVAPASPISATGSEKNFKLEWNQPDNGEGFKQRNSEYFSILGKDDAKAYAENNWLFDSSQMLELNTLIRNPENYNKLSATTRKAVANYAGALGITPAELIKLQLLKFNKSFKGGEEDIKNYWPEGWENNLKVANSLTPPTYSQGNKDNDEQLFVYNDASLNLFGNRGVIWESRKGNQVQTENAIPVPFNGDVVGVEEDPKYGTRVIIKADRDYPELGIHAGDHVVTSNLQSTALTVGSSVRRGESMGLAGSRAPGSTKSLGLKPGEVHTSFYNSNGYTTQDQYAQVFQKNLFKKVYSGLYLSK